MQSLYKEIEESAKRIFRLFFRNRLYLKKNGENINNELIGVNLILNYKGNKKLSLYLEKRTIKSVMERLLEYSDISPEDEVAYDIMGEMASMIVGNALDGSFENIERSNPITSDTLRSLDTNTLYFSSSLGRLAITIEEIWSVNE